METTPSLTERFSGIIQGGNWKSWLLIVLAGGLLVGIALALYYSFTPSKIQATQKAKPTFATYPKVTKIAPLGCPGASPYRLCDFYMASSSYSVFPGAEVYDYVSDSILPLAIKAGVRLVELDIYSDMNDQPVVGLKNQKLGTDYAYNTVPLEACCVSVANNAFNTVSAPASSDPFVLSLVFHTDKTKTLNAASEIVKTTCRSHLLDSEYSFSRKNLALEPICNLQNKLIIVSGGTIKGTHMEELTNMSWSTSHLRRLTYTQASQPHDQDELVNHNRNNITMVVPDIGEDLINNNPQVLFAYGCQWIMMNYGSIDDMMELYISEFQEASTVLKPAALRPLKTKKYKKPARADPALSFQPMRHTSPIYDITV
jgi:hypothetical protein